MGLDMYLTGKKYLPNDWNHPKNNLMEDGFRVSEKSLELGYWRKHANLHGYLVKTFAEEDDCEPIQLSIEDLQRIISFLKEWGELPHTTGFFFGASDNTDEERAFDIDVFQKALDWMQTKDGSWKSVEYRASW